jgi:pimeloyl-ACP methyl ester carboxylesterase
MAEHEVHTLSHGRRVALHWLVDGSHPVIFCHPAPGAGNFDPDPRESGAHDITLLGPDRPGYGASDPVRKDEWATPASAADDIAEILDRLGIRPAGVAGWSAGGRVALALAARRPDLVSRVVVFSTPAPDEEVPWIPSEHKTGIETLRGLPPAAVRARLADMLGSMRPADPHASEASASLGASPADATALAVPGTRERLGDMLTEAWTQGAAGIAADIAGYTLQPWGFEPHGVMAKVLLIYGDADPVAGSAHGEWWRHKLPNAELELVPRMGHLLAVPFWGRALNFLTAD